MAAVERALNDCRPVLFSINAEIDAQARNARSPWPAVADAAQQRIEELRAQAAKTEAEIEHLTGERDRLQRRRDDASQIVGSCRDFLLQRGHSRADLEA